MNDVDSIIFIEDKQHLKQPAIPPGPTHKPLSVAVVFWVRLRRAGNDPFRVFRIDPVPGDVIGVPVIPTEVQAARPI